MKKIGMLLLFTIIICCFWNKNIYAAETGEQINKEDFDSDDVIIKYAEDFLGKLYPEMILKVSKKTEVYNREDEINGYCYNIENDGIPNGYLMISRKDNMIKVSEFAVQENIKNPSEEICSKAKIQSSNIRYYSENPFDFCVWDVDKDVAYEYTSKLTTINRYSTVKEQRCYENKVPKSRSLDGYSVISDTYAGTVTSSNMIPYANSIGFYNRDFVTYIGAEYACGVLAGCNIMKYYRCIGCTNIPSQFSVLYNALWNLMSPDPNNTVNSSVAVQKVRDSIIYFGYNCSYTPFVIDLYYSYKYAIDCGCPIYVGYETWFGNRYSGHAVVAVGYTQTTQNEYLKVADGWNTYLRYLTFDGYDYDVFCGYAFTVTS